MTTLATTHDIEQSPKTAESKPRARENADDIDTQEVLTKANARLAKSLLDQKSGSLTVIAPTPKPKKSRRLVKCLQCRSSRKKCERDGELPDGSCKPCLMAGKQCSFVSDAKFENSSDQVKKDTVCDDRSRVESEVEARPLRRSLRHTRVAEHETVGATSIHSRKSATKKDTSKIVVLNLSHNLKSNGDSKIAPQRQESSKISHDSPVSVAPDSGMSRVSTARSTDLKTIRSINSNQSPTSLVDLPIDARSDITTATVTTDDLDTRKSNSMIRQKRKLSALEDPNTPYVRPKPARVEVRKDDLSCHEADKTVDPLQQSSIPNQNEIDPKASTDNSITLSSFFKMDHTEQSRALDEFFTEKIQDDNFLSFCKILQDRYEPGLFANKW